MQRLVRPLSKPLVWPLCEATLGGAAPVDHGDIDAVDVTGNLIDIASTVAPITTAGDSLTIGTNGWAIAVSLSQAHTVDPTKVQVRFRKPGSMNGVAVYHDHIANGTGEVRRASPNEASKMGTSTLKYVSLDNLIQEDDIVDEIVFAAEFYSGSPEITFTTSDIGRNDSAAYDEVIARFATLPFERVGAGETIDVEVCAIHGDAEASRMVDYVEIWARVGGVDGPVASTQIMVQSAHTPSVGRLPSGVPFPVFRCTVSMSGLSDGSGGFRVRYHPFVGTAWESWVSGDDFPSASPVKELPFLLDTAGVHTPVYAWILFDATGTATGTGKLHTNTTDPGVTVGENYATMSTAAAAIRTYNNARGHDDLSGGVIMLRDVVGSTAGADANSYCVRTAFSSQVTFPPGALPLVIRSVSGVASDAVRVRGTLPDGAAPTSKFVASKIRWIGIKFDSEGQVTQANNIIINNTSTNGSAGTAAAATVFHQLIDTDIVEMAAATSSSVALVATGWRYDIRVDHKTGTNAASMGGAHAATFACLVLSIGSKYHYPTTNNVLPCYPFLGGVWLVNQYLSTQPRITTNLVLPVIRNYIWFNVRLDHASPAQSVVKGGGGSMPTTGVGICGLLLRVYGTPNISYQVGADGTGWEIANYVPFHISIDTGANDNSDRGNRLYQDQRYMRISKRGRERYCAWGSSNSKDGTFPAPELPSATNEGAWVTLTRYFKGDLVHDGNATAGSRIYYHRLTDGSSGAVQATDLADTSAWQVIGAVNGTAFGAQPQRTGTLEFQYGVRCWNNASVQAAGGAGSGTQTGYGNYWLGEVNQRGSVYGATWADYYVDRTGGALGSGLTDYGDYHPNPAGPLADMVPAGKQVCPFDLAGDPRLDDGAGAIGAYERAD